MCRVPVGGTVISMNQGIENSGFHWRTVPKTKSKQEFEGIIYELQYWTVCRCEAQRTGQEESSSVWSEQVRGHETIY